MHTQNHKIWQELACSSPNHSCSEAWWWHPHPEGMLFNGSAWEISQHWGMSKAKYRKVLEENLLQRTQKRVEQRFTFQHDNNQKLAAKIVMWEQVSECPWVTQPSPGDETHRKSVEKSAYHASTTFPIPCDWICKGEKLSECRCAKLVGGQRGSCAAVISAKGDPTKWQAPDTSVKRGFQLLFVIYLWKFLKIYFQFLIMEYFVLNDGNERINSTETSGTAKSGKVEGSDYWRDSEVCSCISV